MYPESHFNHRVLAREYEIRGGIEVCFAIHEVYYKNGKPINYTENAVTVDAYDDEGIEGLRATLDRMLKCLDNPILWAGDKFPQEYVPDEIPNPTPPEPDDDILEPSWEEKIIEKLDKLRELGHSEDKILESIDSLIVGIQLKSRLDDKTK